MEFMKYTAAQVHKAVIEVIDRISDREMDNLTSQEIAKRIVNQLMSDNIVLTKESK